MIFRGIMWRIVGAAAAVVAAALVFVPYVGGGGVIFVGVCTYISSIAPLWPYDYCIQFLLFAGN